MQILLQVMLISLNAIFACAEIAVISMNDNKLAQMATQGDKRAMKLVRLTSQPARFLATIQVAITLSGFMGSAFAADNFSEILVTWLSSLNIPLPLATLDTISVIFITLILSYFTLVFGELVPKRIAMKKAEQLALGLATLISFIAQLFSPVVWFLTTSTNAILRLCGIDPNSEDDEVSEEEIRMMVDVGNQKGVIDYEEKEMIQNIFEFDDLSVGEFATHRRDVTILWMEDSLEEWEKVIHESRHSLYPICDDSIDHVIGILNVKDYFRIKEKTRENIMLDAVKPAYFVPESIFADILFKQMKKSHNHFAVILDEYGGMRGIVTMNDLLEQLVGDLENEFDIVTPIDLEKIDNSTWKVRGCVSLNILSDSLNVSLPIDDFDTLGGYIFDAYGSIPDDGTQFQLKLGKIMIDVEVIKHHRIEKATIHLINE